jgi:hypothetical protein
MPHSIQEHTPALLYAGMADMRAHRSHHALYGAGAARLDRVVCIVAGHVDQCPTALPLHVCIVGISMSAVEGLPPT